MLLADILGGYKGRSITFSHTKDHLPLCMSCHERAARYLEFYDRTDPDDTGGYPSEDGVMACQVVCEQDECCSGGYLVPFHELGSKQGILEWKLQLRQKRWYDGFFDGDVDLAAHWAMLQMCAGVRPLGKPAHVPRVRDKSKRHISARLRAYVMERDNFRCRRCGASSRQEGIILHVDHIVAVANGGTTEEKNLQTLCGRCNIGKSDREPHQHDLRP